MFLLKPKYLNENLSVDERLMYLHREKNPKRLREVFENQKLPFQLRKVALEREKDTTYLEEIVKNVNEFDDFRDYALNKVSSPELCEFILKNCKYDPTFIGGDIKDIWQNILYFNSAKKLNYYDKQNILENIYNTTPHDGIKIIVLQYITNESFLYDVAKNAEGYNTAEAAITNIHNETILKDLTIQNQYCGNYAIDKINNQNALKEIVLKQKNIFNRENAIKKIIDPSDLIKPLRDEYLSSICDDPLNNYMETEVLARTKDKTARIILLLTNGEYFSVTRELGINCNEILETDLDIIYPIIKKLIAIVCESHSYKPKELISGLKKCIQILHYNNILVNEIETEIPKSITISGEYRDYYGDGYEKYSDEQYKEEIELW